MAVAPGWPKSPVQLRPPDSRRHHQPGAARLGSGTPEPLARGRAALPLYAQAPPVAALRFLPTSQSVQLSLAARPRARPTRCQRPPSPARALDSPCDHPLADTPGLPQALELQSFQHLGPAQDGVCSEASGPRAQGPGVPSGPPPCRGKIILDSSPPLLQGPLLPHTPRAARAAQGLTAGPAPRALFLTTPTPSSLVPTRTRRGQRGRKALLCPVLALEPRQPHPGKEGLTDTQTHPTTTTSKPTLTHTRIDTGARARTHTHHTRAHTHGHTKTQTQRA
ncbi:uncharacterized protein LOC124904970 [Homo sapiens]|uniref:uncharacterized protein LOC124904970 n=1 Tax=Homo sapiens TaxID=9606 RepID=UPI001FB079A4|nr:uncharacterized protein LOC124904970 [Homo sapiens]